MPSWTITITHTALAPVLFATLLFAVACQGDQRSPRSSCDCKLEKLASEEEGQQSSNSNSEIEASGKIGAKLPMVKKLIQAEAELSGTFREGQASSETVYWKFVAANPDVVQGANLYRNITCALIEIACENPEIGPGAFSRIQNQLVREYQEKVEEILRRAHEERRQPPELPTAPRKESSSANGKRPVQPATRPAPAHLMDTDFAQVAILAVGDKSHRDLSLSLGQWLKEQGVSANNSLFRPSFWTTYRNRLATGDLGPFAETEVQRLANCVCVFDQSSNLKESTLAGEQIITAIFSGRIKIFDLRRNQVGSFELNARGAGITIARAMENVEEKLNAEFANLSSMFSKCR